MQKYIWLVPLLPLIGAAINGLLGRKLRFSETLIGGIAVGSVALSFLISVAAVIRTASAVIRSGPNLISPARTVLVSTGFRVALSASTRVCRLASTVRLKRTTKISCGR